MIYGLIMAGGIGSRFWPKSRIGRPKQFLEFFGSQSLIQTTINRIRPLIPPERIIVSTNSDYAALVKEQIPDIPDENIIGEPVAKNTGPCIAFAAALIRERDPDATMVVLPSDHFIRNEKAFLEDLENCVTLANEKEELVTIGIPPTRPETGYGYIQYVDKESVSNTVEESYVVKTFAEKPDLDTALKFLQSGDFLWNSGMFIWKAKSILKEIKEHLPVLFHQVEIFQKSLSENEGKIDQKTLEKVYNSCFSVSIDYGIMEKSGRVLVLLSHFDWSDLGSWMAIYELQKEKNTDEYGNVIQQGKSICINSENCYLDSDNKKLIALVGLQGIGVIETKDAILICRLDSSQDVKEVYNHFNDKSLPGYR